LLQFEGVTDEDYASIVMGEAANLEIIRSLEHTNLIKAIALYRHGRRYFIMFPWAEGGNLRDFWRTDPPNLDRQYLEWAFSQLRDLASAIKKSHEKGQCRHGDIKPENILCSKKKRNSSYYTLVITDLGLAKAHEKVTELRRDATQTKSGTVMYEPPESELRRDEPRSRRYDIWSFGCMYLEFAIWLLYGTGELGRFREELHMQGSKFYMIPPNQVGQYKTAQINDAVEKWLSWIKKDPRCPKNTAFRRLVELIEKRLLIPEVGVPQRTTKDSGPSNIHAPEFSNNSGVSEKQLPSIVRTSTNSTKPSAVIAVSGTRRADATEMYQAMKIIVTDASNLKIDWIKENGPAQFGPGRYGKNLAIPPAGAAKRTGDNAHGVRQCLEP
jgi:serine/threonine protein kinase